MSLRAKDLSMSIYVGNNARGTKVTASKFDEKVQGFRLGAYFRFNPIVRN